MDKKKVIGKLSEVEIVQLRQNSININELRIKNGLEPIQGGDQNFIPEEIFNKFSQALDETAKEFINGLKNNCKTYGEINEKVRLFKKEISYNCKEIAIGVAFISHVEELLEEEKSNLPLADCSKKE